MTMEVRLSCWGQTVEDRKLALDEAVSRINEGHLKGGEDTDEGGYFFDVDFN